jgi:hypothetical protein
MKLITLSKQEREKFERNRKKIISRIPDHLDKNSYEYLIKEIDMGLYRDIQAQRLPPNIKIPSRKKPLKYIKTMYENTRNLKTSLVSLFLPGSWTSSGGSFKLAEDASYDIIDLLSKREQENGKAVLLEVGAGYAGFKSQSPQGIHKLYKEVGEKLGKTIFVHFTNLSEWHNELPNGVTEHAGYAARDIEHLIKEANLNDVDVIYSQCAAYFEPFIGKFVESSSHLLNVHGKLIFNAPENKEKEILEKYECLPLDLELSERLEGESNGTLYVFRRYLAD